MKWRYPILIFAGLCCSAWGFIYRPFPMPGEDPALDLVLYNTPTKASQRLFKRQGPPHVGLAAEPKKKIVKKQLTCGRATNTL